MMIKPTVGRVVWFWNGVNQSQPMAATVAYVFNDRMVNLSVTDSNGKQFSQTSVLLLQGDETYKPIGAYCEWMPYQHQAAKKDEAPYPGANPVADAMAVVTKALREDDGYLIGWHANIAIAAIDAGCPRDVAQEAGAKFLHLLAGVDVRKRSWFKPAAEVETKTYPDGTTATGTAPLPDASPTADAPDWVAVRRPVCIGSGKVLDDVWIRCKVTRVHGCGRVVDIVNPDGTREALELGANCRAVSAPEPDQSTAAPVAPRDGSPDVAPAGLSLSDVLAAVAPAPIAAAFAQSSKAAT